MAVQPSHHLPHRLTFGLRLPARHTATADTLRTTVRTATAARTLAAGRVVLGSVFLWAFLDKTFGWGYATRHAAAWINGGSPTRGFLGHVAAGPMQSTFHSWAGAGWADWLFMLGLAGIGAALLSGVALRIAAAGGTVLLALMWAAEWPPARHLSSGAASMSSNPLVDYHVVYAMVLITLAVLGAGETWGLGRLWAELPLVRDHAWLR